MAPLIALLLGVPLALASSWRGPPSSMTPALGTPPPPLDLVSPSGRWAATLTRPSPLPRSALPADPLRVAGLSLDPRTLVPVGAPWFTELVLRRPQGARQPPFEPSLPRGRILDPEWSPDQDRLALSLATDEGLSLWVVEPEERRARRLTGPTLHRATGPACTWLPDEEGLLCKLRSGSSERSLALGQRATEPHTEEGQGAPPPRGGPRVESEHEASLVLDLLAATLHRVGVDGARQQLAAAAPLLEVCPSPEGAWAALRSWRPPVRAGERVAELGQRLEVLDLFGRVLLPVEDLEPGEEQALTELRWTSPDTLTWTRLQQGSEAHLTVTAPFREPHPGALPHPPRPLPAPVHRSGALEVPLARLPGGRLVVQRQSPTRPPELGLRDPRADKGGLTLFYGQADPVPSWRGERRPWRCPAAPEGALFTPPADPPFPTLVWLSTAPLPHPEAFVRPAGASPLWMVSAGWAVLLLAPDSDVEAASACLGADPSRLVLGAAGPAAAPALEELLRTDHLAAGVLQGAEWSALLSPSAHPLSDAPPLLLLGGDLDPLPPHATEAAYRALRAAGVHARWVQLPGEPSAPLSREGVGQVLAELYAWCTHAVEE